MESAPFGFYRGSLQLKGYSEDQVGYHITLMTEAGLVESVNVTTYDSPSPVALPRRITWKGYEFLDACRDEQRWITAKEIVNLVKGASFDIISMVLADLIKKQIPLSAM